MSITESFKNPTNQPFSTNYLPAVLREYKSRWVIEYYVENPLTKKMVRKVKKVNRILNSYSGSKTKARSHINKMVNNINVQLAGGWNPLFYSDDARLYTPVTKVFELYLSEKTKELRPKSMISYNDFCNTFSPYIRKIDPGMFASMITKIMCITWIDDLYRSRNFGVCRYNNFVKAGRAFFNWALEKCYVKENPFNTIKLKPKPHKQRQIIPKDIRTEIIHYLNQNNPNMLILLKMMYNTLLRPNEIRMLKIKNIDFATKSIIVPGEIAKNGNQRIVAMTNDLYNDLINMKINEYSDDFYIFTAKFKPGKNIVADHYYSNYWAIIRKKLQLPKEMQLYSLRDTGIFDMLKAGIDDLSIMQHADHHSLEMTTIYANHADPHLGEIIRSKSPTF